MSPSSPITFDIITKKVCGFRKKIKPQHTKYIGILIILVATLIYFWPVVTRISSYNPGGDAAFNAWTLARDQHCILGQNCSNYANGNIFYPNKDTMLYSEDQLSAGFVTLPLYFINQNPIFSYNVWTILSFLFAGIFMYLLVRYISKGNQSLSILAGLVFEFAPLKIAALQHLQNLSIFYLPLAFLLIYRYLDSKRRLYLVLTFIACGLLFYASWYQMAFALAAFVIFLLGLLVFKLYKWRKILPIAISILLAVVVTLPLAKQYVDFSKSTSATFSISQQAIYSSSLADYFIPNSGTLLGKLYYDIRPHSQVNAYNPDSWSYHGYTLYALATAIIVLSFIYWRKHKKIEIRRRHKMLLIYAILGIVAVILSLGPLLKLKGNYAYPSHSLGLSYILPMPYILVDKLFPQLSFIRAIGRISVLALFSLCALLGFVALYLKESEFTKKTVWVIMAVIIILVAIDILPDQRVPMSSDPADYNLSIPAAYKFIHNDKAIQNYIVLAADNKTDYSNVPYDDAIASELLWGGYANKDMFNGTSGYIPPNYYSEYISFLNFNQSTEQKIKNLGIKYIVIDKTLSAGTNLATNANRLLSKNLVYNDNRYDIYRVN